MSGSPLAHLHHAYAYTSLSSHHPKTSKRNTVHWNKHDLAVDVKENTLPAPKKAKSNNREQQSVPPRPAYQYSPRFLLDLRYGNRKLRGCHPRPHLAAETFVAPEPPEPLSVETTPVVDADSGW